MNESEIREEQLQAVRDLKSQGVTAIKLELEGTIQRRNVSGTTERCGSCSGRGRSACTGCSGIGWLVDAEGYETDDECGLCESAGYIQCDVCSGSGRVAKYGRVDLSDDGVAFSYFMGKVAEKTKTKLRRLNGQDKVNPFDWMSFARLYWDGSVDTEVTFTVKLDNEENIFHIPKVLEAFREMAEDHGQGLDVRGAGMHTGLLFDSDCRYPSDAFPFTSSTRDNFRRAATQLLPAMYFLATATGRSRGMNFRPPVIDGHQKQSAIAIHHGAIEFRIFDTCYERPQAALDNIVVIRNVMRYMSRDYVSPEIGEAVKKREITFGNNTDQTVGRLFVTSDQLGALYAGLPKIKPAYYTVDQLKEQREFNRTLDDAAAIEREQQEQAEVEYAEYAERHEWQVKAREKEIRGYIMRDVVQRMSVTQLRSMTQEKIDEMCASRVEAELRSYKNGKQKAEKYISSRLEVLRRAGQGEFNVALA